MRVNVTNSLFLRPKQRMGRLNWFSHKECAKLISLEFELNGFAYWQMRYTFTTQMSTHQRQLKLTHFSPNRFKIYWFIVCTRNAYLVCLPPHWTHTHKHSSIGNSFENKLYAMQATECADFCHFRINCDQSRRRLI